MRLINADKIYPDVRTQHGALAISQGQLAYVETVNAILIPENATNGDVIKAIFPQIESETTKGLVEVFYLDCSDRDIHTDFYAEWWNAPYKTESGV